MTRLELQSLVRVLIGDRTTVATQQPFTAAELNTLINLAMQRVASFARSLQRSLFFAEVVLADINPGGALTYAVTLPVTGYTRVHRLLYVLATTAGTTRSLPLVAVRDGASELLVSGDERLRAAAANEQLYLLSSPPLTVPPILITLRVGFIAGLNDMDQDANTPGQWGTGPQLGAANFLPVVYHGLIALKAGVLALKALGADFTALQTDYTEGMQVLQADLAEADRSPER